MKTQDANDILRERGPEVLRERIDAGHGAGALGGQDQEQNRNRLVQSSASFVGGFVPPDYLIDGILQRGFFYALTGKTGGGKTAIALLITASVATGQHIGKNEVTKGRVLYFAGENPDDIRMRWIVLAQEMNFDIETVDVHFIPGTFEISKMRTRIIDEVKALGPVALVVIDTSAAYFEGEDENSNTQQGTHARRLRSLVDLPGRPCMVACCHPVKNAGDDNLIPRGGGAFIAEVDGNLTAAKSDLTVELHWQGKLRGPDFSPIMFVLRTVTCATLKDSKGRMIPSVVATQLSETGQEEITSTARINENKLLEALATHERASLAELATSLGWFMRSGQPHKMMVKRILDKLQKYKLVTLERDGPVLTDKGEKALKALK